MNHCAYVGIVTGVKPKLTEEYFEELLRLQSFPALWNSRFEDTLGVYYLLKAERMWDAASPEERPRLNLSSLLVTARVHLERASERDPGDIDLQEHRTRLERLENNYVSARGAET